MEKGEETRWRRVVSSLPVREEADQSGISRIFGFVKFPSAYARVGPFEKWKLRVPGCKRTPWKHGLGLCLPPSLSLSPPSKQEVA